MQLSTQWRVHLGMGGAWWQGLPYDTALALMRDAGRKRSRRRALLADLRTLEAAALPILNLSTQE